MRRSALTFIVITVVLDMLALGIIIPVLPKLLLEFEGGDSARAASVSGVFGIVFNAMQFLCAPVLGALSDRVGRRPILLLSTFGLGLDYAVMAVAPSVRWLLLGRVIAGVCAATFTTAGAYIADVTPPERRAASFGLLSAAFGFGFVIGPAFGGFLGQVNPRYPFWGAAALSLLNTLYGFFVLPESLPPDRRAPFRWSRANPFAALGWLRQQESIARLVVVVFLSRLAHEVLPSVSVLYTLHRYGWTTGTVGLSMAIFGGLGLIFQGRLLGPTVARLGEPRSLRLGLTLGALAFSIYGLAPTGALYFAGIPFAVLWGMAGPSAQALMTRRVLPTEQGRLQGALGGVQGIAGLIGPGLFTGVFAAAVGRFADWHVPGAPFLVAATLLAAGAVVARAVTE